MMSLRSLSCAAGAAVAVCLIGATPAAAAPPSSVTITANGSSTAGTVAATVTGSIQWKNMSTGFTINCPSVNLPLVSKVGLGLSPNAFATINPTASSLGGSGGCKVGQYPETWTPSGTWRINAISPSNPAANGAPTLGQTSLIRFAFVKVSVSSGSCTFDLTGFNGAPTGSVDPTLTNGSPSTVGVPATSGAISSASSTLVVSNLKVFGASCFGVKGNGDVWSITSNTALSVNPNNTAQRPLWLNTVT